MSDFQREEKIPEKYRLMSTADRWRWHASVYAFRRVVMNVSRDETTSPCDPEGKWFNEQMVAAAEYNLRQQGRMRSKSYREGRPYGADPAGGRAIKQEWCQKNGYRDFPEYMLNQKLNPADDYDYGTACVRIAESIAGEAVLRNQKAFREQRGKRTDRHDAAQSLGVSAREEIKYTPEQMRAARIALGIEKAEAAE